MNLVPSNHLTLAAISRKVEAAEIPDLKASEAVLLKFMRENGGAGLAANQLGDTRRYFVWAEGLVINPEILEASKEMRSEREGCLSFPGSVISVRRPVWIKAIWVNADGDNVMRLLKKGWARVFQHELDHLNGKTIISYIS